MTSASELFHNRRSRISRNEPGLGFGSSSSSSSSSPHPLSLDRSRRRSRHHHHHHRHGEISDSDHSRRSSHSRHLCNREHEPVRFDHGASQSGTGNSSSSGTSSGRANRIQFGRSEQLPGDVLLARERLVERLRGVSLSSNRQSSRSISGIWDEYTQSDDFTLVDAGDWEIETSARWLAGDTTFPDSQTVLPDFDKKRPPGLNLEEVNHLHHEVFTQEDNVSEVVLECTICLNRFQKAEELTCLPCQHKFHSRCLYPWVKICGDCPNCRATVVIGKH